MSDYRAHYESQPSVSVDFLRVMQSAIFRDGDRIMVHLAGGDGGVCVRNPLAKQIISNLAIFQPESEFTPLILASKSECS